jgi:hypothetical protein
LSADAFQASEMPVAVAAVWLTPEGDDGGEVSPATAQAPVLAVSVTVCERCPSWV